MLWCLHGALGSYRDWEPVLPDARHVDLWETDGDGDMQSWAARWTAQVAQEDPEPVLLGYSMGGRLGLHALLAAPTLWKRAIIVSAHPGLRGEEERVRRQQSDQAWLTRFQMEPMQAVLEDWSAQPALNHGISSLPKPTTFQPRMARCFRAWSLGQQAPLWDQLDRIPCPVLWFCGAEDPKFAALGQEAAARLPQGTYREVADCGHRLPWQHPDFSSLIR